MDMMPPIWPCARRCIQTKKPISNSTRQQQRDPGLPDARRSGVENLMPLLGEQLGVGVGQRRGAGGGDLVAVGELAGDVAVGVVVGGRLHLVVLTLASMNVAVGDRRCRSCSCDSVEDQDGHRGSRRAGPRSSSGASPGRRRSAPCGAAPGPGGGGGISELMAHSVEEIAENTRQEPIGRAQARRRAGPVRRRVRRRRAGRPWAAGPRGASPWGTVMPAAWRRHRS